MFKRVKIKANGQEVSAEGVGCLRGDHVEKRGERRVLPNRRGKRHFTLSGGNDRRGAVGTPSVIGAMASAAWEGKESRLGADSGC